MLFKILGRVLASLATLMFFTLVRIYFFTMAHPMPRSTLAAGSAQASYREGMPLAAPDHSGWIVFNSTDPQTGLRTRHARLTGAPGNTLELLQGGKLGQHVILTLATASGCATATDVSAIFDKRPTTLAVKPVAQAAGCIMEFVDYAGVLHSLQDADVLTVRNPTGQDVSFDVAGLSWD